MLAAKPNTPLHILLADDDIDDCQFFKKALKEIPIATNLTIVHDGEQLMNYLSKHTNKLPDTLFLDLSMPRKTGFECLTEIKENASWKDIPVIVFTTSFSSVDFEQSLVNILSTIGAQEYIRKPGGMQELKKIIHDSLIKVIEKTKN
jgi:CheY-like chemotaxis protein